MEELRDIATIAVLVNQFTQLGVSFNETFKGWNSKKISYKDRKAAWELYVEMETRIITQPLHPKHGDEQTALDKVRCFTAKWHSKSCEGAFSDPAACAEFRDDLEKLQEVLRAYTRTLAVLAGVEDTDSLSNTEQE